MKFHYVATAGKRVSMPTKTEIRLIKSLQYDKKEPCNAAKVVNT